MEPGNVVPDGHLPASCELVESSKVETASSDDLWQRLQSIDSDSAARIHPNDRRKVKRYVCLCVSSVVTSSVNVIQL